MTAPHVCCGCGGLCDSAQPCPMAGNCRCRGVVRELDADQREQLEALVATLGSTLRGLELLELIAAGRVGPSMARLALEQVAVRPRLYDTDRRRAQAALQRLDAAQVDAVPRHVAREGGGR